MSTIQTFSAYSNYKLNPSKCEALNISLPQPLVHSLKSSYPFRWQPHSLKYLGVQVPSNLADTYKLNYPPLLHTLKLDLARWERRDFSWIGRVNILKMNILPRLLYLFSCIPFHIPRVFFRELSALQSSFVWARKHPRLAKHVLIRRKTDGGLALPDYVSYYLAATLTRVLDSCHQRARKQWVGLEGRMIGCDPMAFFWRPPHASPAHTVSSLPPVILSVHQARRHYMSKLSLFPRHGPLTPLFDNPLFPPTAQQASFLGLSRGAGVTFHSLLTPSSLKPLSDILGDTPPSPTHLFQYAQLRHFYRSSRDTLNLHRQLSVFEKLCVSSHPRPRTVSTLYALLLDDMTSQPLPFKAGWERELGYPLSDDDWKRVMLRCHKSSISSKAQETNYKILTRWYRVPALLASFYPGVSNTCWRCNSDVGTLTHIWLTCPSLATYWTNVLDTIKHITSVSLPPTPEVTLLSLLPPHASKGSSRLLTFLLLAARTVIPRLWKSHSPPTLSSWLQETSHIHRMEELLADTPARVVRYEGTWSPWISFLGSKAFEDLHPQANDTPTSNVPAHSH